MALKLRTFVGSLDSSVASVSKFCVRLRGNELLDVISELTFRALKLGRRREAAAAGVENGTVPGPMDLRGGRVVVPVECAVCARL